MPTNTPTSMAIAVRQLSFGYDPANPILHNISFSLNAGERLAILGPNGAGKSTLLLHLNGLLPEKKTDWDERVLTLDGKSVPWGNRAWLRRQVGFLFQNPDDQLFAATVGEDIRYGPEQLGLSESEIRQRVLSSLKAVGLECFESRNSARLSLGEKKRACLAGILACQPTILALDEPTSSLDPRGRSQVTQLLASLPQTMIVATHDLELARRLCSRTLILDAGFIAADGPTEALLAEEQLLESHGLRWTSSTIVDPHSS